jgi:hypothetical protein
LDELNLPSSLAITGVENDKNNIINVTTASALRRPISLTGSKV